MKKITLTLIMILLALTLCGCNNKNSKAYTAFNEQLDNVESVVSSTNSSEISDVSSSMIYNENQSLSKINYYKTLSNNNMYREEEIRQQILALNGYLKSCNNNLKLNKSQLNALKNVTSNLKKVTKELKNTKSDIKSTVSSIKKDNKTSKNDASIESDYLILNNHLDERYVCMLNIYNNLNFACDILCENHTNFDQPVYRIEPQNTVKEENKAENDKEDSKKFKKNIDSYNQAYKDNQENKKYPYQTMMPNNPYMNNRYFGGKYGMNNYNMYNGMYGYGYNGFGFNPGRNTDTFYPFGRNIDTYRYNPNFFNGMNNLGSYPAWNDSEENTQKQTDCKDCEDDNCCENNCCEKENIENKVA